MNIILVQNKSDKAWVFKGMHSFGLGFDLMIVDILEGLPISMVSSPATFVPE
jgi:hypothetical protein